jgi:hypothetical protein
MTKRDEPRLCVVCTKKSEQECSHIDCPNRRHTMQDPFDSRAYESLGGSGSYKRQGANYPEYS